MVEDEAPVAGERQRSIALVDDDRTVDSHIKRLRRKFRAADPEFGAIETLYGAGYSFSDG